MNFEIERHEFSSDQINSIDYNKYLDELWPLVYILSNGNIYEAYVGETTDAYSRMSAHLKNNEKKKLNSVHFITSDNFNKSATLDIESNLIRYISGDGKYKLLNGNLGLANHTYYQKKIYWNLFLSLWDRLRTEGIAQHSIEFINNSDLFKYSPYKTLSKDQRKGLISIIEGLLNDNCKNIIVEGGAGTGKSILAIFLFKILNSEEEINYKEFEDDQLEVLTLSSHLKSKFRNPKMALVVPMSSFRNTLKKVFQNIKGLKASMVIGPLEVAKEHYDILIVDESHRLRRRRNIVNYASFDKACEQLNLNKKTANELQFVQMQSNKSVLFYDQDQSIRPSDVEQEFFDKLKDQETTKVEILISQFRCKGGNSYVKFVDGLLGNSPWKQSQVFHSKNYELKLFNSVSKMVDEIKEKNEKFGLSRVIAGFSWPWISRKEKKLYDIEIDGQTFKWNSTTDDWINSKEAINEIGCIHTSQGYDLNYVGVIFGKEITYNPSSQKIEILKENYFDKNGKNGIQNIDVLTNYIINIYKTMMLRGIMGTYVYACDENLRNYFSNFIQSSDTKTKPLDFEQEIVPYKNSIPFYSLKPAAGTFSEQQNSIDKEFIRVPDYLKPSENLFACKVIGESMNKVIPNGSICVFSKYEGGTRNGLIVLVENSNYLDIDFGSYYTVKEYHSTKVITDEGWTHNTIHLKPLSYNQEYSELVLTDNELENFKVIGVFKTVLNLSE